MLTLSATTIRRRLKGGCEDERGIVGVNLAIILAFALFAVIQLTRTTLAAQQIDDRVEVIIAEVQPIDEDLDNVKILDEVDETAKGILAAAEPLSGQAGQIVGSLTSIDGKVAQILDTAGSINGVVQEINGTAKSIGGTVNSIGSTVNRLQPVVQEINGGSGFTGVSGINQRVDIAIDVVANIETDLANTNALVGSIGQSAAGINGGIVNLNLAGIGSLEGLDLGAFLAGLAGLLGVLSVESASTDPGVQAQSATGAPNGNAVTDLGSQVVEGVVNVVEGLLQGLLGGGGGGGNGAGTRGGYNQ